MPDCPACGCTSTRLIRSHSIEAAATHLIAPRQDPVRHGQLRIELARLWDAEQVEVRRCATCGFVFADPFVAATAEIYNLMSGGTARYPNDRFEFGATISTLKRAGRPLRMLEIGTGLGAFMKKARLAGVVKESVTTEYDEAALESLRGLAGNTAFRGGITDLVLTQPEPFDAICMFQVLEHMDNPQGVFADLRALTAPGGALFIGVPNAESVEVQESLTGFWEMPPNHIGRWTLAAIKAAAEPAGFEVAEDRLEDASAAVELWRLAKCRWEARAYAPGSLGARINGIADRRIHGPLKRTLVAQDMVMLAPHLRRIPPQSHWFHLTASGTS
jgi:SAM-dependent methyltransferase